MADFLDPGPWSMANRQSQTGLTQLGLVILSATKDLPGGFSLPLRVINYRLLARRKWSEAEERDT